MTAMELAIMLSVKGAPKAQGDLKKTAAAAQDVGDATSKAGGQQDSFAKSGDRVTKSAADQEKAHKKTSRAMDVVKRSTAGLAVGAVGLVAAAAASGRITDEWTEAQVVGKRTNQVIKTMGADSWTSADAIEALSGNLSKKTAIDDEAVQSNANLLLTFGKVRNEVGAGNDVFDQSVGLSLDLSEAMGMSQAGAAKTLGKALNDPIKGITALQRAGVGLTKGQQDQIKSMVAAGDTLGAQKIILGEVSKQVGGAAAGAKTQGKQLDVAFGNLAETAGGILMPAMNLLSGVLVAVVGVVSSVIEGVQSGNPIWTAATVAVAALTAGFVAFKAVAAIQGLLAAVRGGMLALNLAIAANPIGLAVAAVVALVAAFVVAYKKIGWFREGVNAVWSWIKGHWPLILSILTGPIGAAVIYIIRHWDQVVDFVKGLPGKISKAASGMWDGIKDSFKSVINWIIRAWNGLEFKLPEGDVLGVHLGGGTIGVPNIPELASGGQTAGVGSWMSGEAGPELNTRDRNGNVTVTPLSPRQARKNRRGMNGGGIPAVTVVNQIGSRSLSRELGFVRAFDAGYSHG